MLKDLPSPEYTKEDAFQLFRVRVFENGLLKQLDQNARHALALGFLLGLNFNVVLALKLANEFLEPGVCND